MKPPWGTLREWLSWQEGLHPVSIDLGLDRLRPVAGQLGLSELAMPVITIAGTNGKGSSVVYLEALLRSHGLSTGSYSSPWLHRYNECVRINGQAVSDALLLQSFARVEQARAGASLTCFEYRTLAAVDLITRAGVDVALLEVGLGGRLDAVNLWAADVSLITTLGLDHQQWLGADLESVAREKAGIMRSEKICVCADSAMRRLLEPHARLRGARLLSAERDYQYSRQAGFWSYHSSRYSFEQLPLPALAGHHQLSNAAGAITVLAGLARMPELSRARVAAALAAARLPGRLEYRPGKPAVLLDVAHNPQACSVLASWLEAHRPGGDILAVCGMYQDKDPLRCFATLKPWISEWHLGSLPPPRGAEADQLLRALGGRCRSRHSYATISAAFQGACARAADADLVVVFGSFETVRLAAAELDNAG